MFTNDSLDYLVCVKDYTIVCSSSYDAAKISIGSIFVLCTSNNRLQGIVLYSLSVWPDASRCFYSQASHMLKLPVLTILT